MNGTSTPWSGFVMATSDCGFAGSYGCRPLLLGSVDLYRNVYFAGWLQPASTAPDGQRHGWTCGPENTGPSFGELTTLALAEKPGACTCTTLLPRRKPLTRATRRPFASRPNSAESPLPLALTETSESLVPAGSATATSTSPPLTRSARFDSTC